MNKPLARIAHAVLAEPWLVIPSHHAIIREVVEAHITGKAHLPDGCAVAYEDDEDENKKPAPAYTMDGNVAIVPVMGTLGMRVGSLAKCSGMADYLDVQAALNAAQADLRTEAIVLSIDSPGGQCVGCPEVAEHVAMIAERIPVVAHTDSLMASAAYWIGSQATKVVATGSAHVGSIGVYLALLDSSVAYAQEGVKMELFKAGKYKAIGLPGISLTDEQREMLQAEVDEIYDAFRASVQHRGIPQAGMEGQTLAGEAAIAMRLVDETGGLDEAVELARELIGNHNTKQEA